MDAVSRVLLWAQEHFGFSWDDAAYAEVHRKLSMEAKDRGHGDAQAFARYLLEEACCEDRVRLLASMLTIGETYFFREYDALEALLHHALPEILRDGEIRKDKTIRLWSAGCSTGEEAYTVAMMLTEALRGNRPWTFTLLATDVNEKALETARLGRYRSYSFRDSVPEPYERYVVREAGGTFRVREELKDHIQFQVLNLASAAYPSAVNGTWNLDVVLCRNVLMYLQSDTRREVLRRLHESLREGGWLLLSASEVHLADCGLWEAVRTPRATLFRKRAELYLSREKFGQPAAVALSRSLGGNAQSPLDQMRSQRRDEAHLARTNLQPGFSLGSAGVSPAQRSGRKTVLAGVPPISKVGHHVPHFSSMIGQASGDLSSTTQGFYASRQPTCHADKELQDVETELARLVSLDLLEEATALAEHHLKTCTGSTASPRTSPALLNLFRVLAARHQVDKAMSLLHLALNLHRWDPALYHLKGAFHADRGEWQEAIAAYRQMVYVAPESASALFSLAMLSWREGHREAAFRYLDGARKVLEGKDDKEEAPFSDGMSVGHLRDLIEKFMKTLESGLKEWAP